MRLSALFLSALLLGGLTLPVFAQSDAPADAPADQEKKSPNKVILDNPPGRDLDWHFTGEVTGSLQHLFKFPSPYVGANSLLSRDETELAHSYTLSIKKRLNQNFTIYIIPELALGNAVGEGVGVSGGVNADILGQPSEPYSPYLSRYFAKYHVWFNKDAQSENADIALDPHPGQVLFHLGKFAVTDIFDRNSYANDPRGQFMNAGLVNNLAADYPQDTRGYTLGMTVQWVRKAWILRLGTFAVPVAPGADELTFNLDRNHSDQLELELHPHLLKDKTPLIVRAQAYRNVASMGDFQDAINAAGGGVPSTSNVTQQGNVKYGYGFNLEQALADDGDTGLFMRWGWNNGKVESFSSAEADRIFSIGAQISGKRWKRDGDMVGVGYAQSDISAAHQDYLAAGGVGLNVGDGMLNYGSEGTLELYYSRQLKKNLALTTDFQQILNTGYNQDRSPASLLAFRLHWTF